MIFGIFKTKKNLAETYKLAKQWIKKYTVDEKGIAVNSALTDRIYPEVTGYYIPTLLLWGDKDRAIKFADYLISIQNEDGSWNEPLGKVAYTFDTGQILKGLIALVDEKPEYKESIIKGCNWIVAQQRTDGSISTPDYSSWKLPYNKRVPETIHIYVIEPLKIAAKKWNIPEYEECAQKALNFYLHKSDLTDFDTLSHFNAYVIEGLIDLGHIDRAKSAMDNIAKYQRRDGSVPAYSNVKFVCSTGLFQYAICWYKLNDINRGNKAFEHACKLQNKTGGWNGSYGWQANYFPKSEISWAVKYFLDAMYWKIRCEFNNTAYIFPTEIAQTDGRYKLIDDTLTKEKARKVIDIGCGKGRFITKLKEKHPDIDAYGIDISEEILKSINPDIKTKQGSLLQIPFPDNSFDLGFCVEALEHSVDVEAAIKEMTRIIKPGGSLIIIDKNAKKLGCMKLPEWECWFYDKELAQIMNKSGLSVDVIKNLPYESAKRTNDLFIGWIGQKNNQENMKSDISRTNTQTISS